MLQVPAVSGIRVVMLTSFLTQSSRRAYASIREWKWIAWGRERQRFTVAGLYEYYYWTMTHLILTGFLCCCCFKKKMFLSYQEYFEIDFSSPQLWVTCKIDEYVLYFFTCIVNKNTKQNLTEDTCWEPTNVSFLSTMNHCFLSCQFCIDLLIQFSR